MYGVTTPGIWIRIIGNFEAANWKVYSEGETSGQLYGGNLCTLNLLQGTPYMPDLSDCILFFEDDELVNPAIFARDLTSILQTTTRIKGLAIGRFQRASDMTEEQLHFILNKHPMLKTIPAYMMWILGIHSLFLHSLLEETST